MSRRSVALFVFTLMLALTAAVRCAAETEDYSIDNYELTVQCLPGSTSVRVTMEITYRIRSGTKSTGFKFIGNYDAQDLSGQDDEGRVMKTWVDHQRETRVNWAFAGAGPGSKRVIVTFTIPDAITNGSSNENRFEAAWAGVFKVPVNKSVYRFVFPDNSERHVVCTPAEYSTRQRNNCRSIEMTQSPFHNANFEITFWPRVVDGGLSLASIGRKARAVSGSWLSSQFSNVLFWGVIIIFVIVISRFKKARRSGSSSWWSSGSSCAGGSSCSSCGSSCGGGCGGGCGG